MRLIPRVLVVAILLVAMLLLIRHVKVLADVEDVEMSKLVTYYIGILALAAVTALVSCVSLLPLLGEFAGNVMFTPNEQIERSPHAEALARMAAGDFQGAIDEYRAVFEADPQDLHAASELVRLYCEKIHAFEPAEDFLVEALSYEDRTPEETAFLSQRLVDVCWIYQKDGIRARAILIKIAEDMPETREAANALHRLQEIDRAMNQDIYLPHQPAVGDAVAQSETEAPEESGTPLEKAPEA
ncbi:MAG: hypothetical protein NTZ46_04280 [Verrucomicrobia bacterium]|nr:hypothetical protein [Verrucomicrobiota bacterium]